MRNRIGGEASSVIKDKPFLSARCVWHLQLCFVAHNTGLGQSWKKRRSICNLCLQSWKKRRSICNLCLSTFNLTNTIFMGGKMRAHRNYKLKIRKKERQKNYNKAQSKSLLTASMSFKNCSMTFEPQSMCYASSHYLMTLEPRLLLVIWNSWDLHALYKDILLKFKNIT